MFEELYDAISFVASWRWPKADGEVTTADAERIGSGSHTRFHLAVAYKFSVDGDGHYTGWIAMHGKICKVSNFPRCLLVFFCVEIQNFRHDIVGNTGKVPQLSSVNEESRRASNLCGVA